jgi:hypothetical protein
MASNEDKDPHLPDLPLALVPSSRLELEMVVLDEDRAEAEEFLAGQGIEPEQDADALAVCRAWLKSLREAKRGKLRIG